MPEPPPPVNRHAQLLEKAAESTETLVMVAVVAVLVYALLTWVANAAVRTYKRRKERVETQTRERKSANVFIVDCASSKENARPLTHQHVQLEQQQPAKTEAVTSKIIKLEPSFCFTGVQNVDEWLDNFS